LIGELKIDSKITRTPVVETSSAFCVFRNCVMIEKHQRKTIRLKEYDYSQPGDYFVTICTQDHEYTFGKIINGEMQLNNVGNMVKECWEKISVHFKNVELDSYIIMPNHLHGIIAICECDGSRGEVTSPLLLICQRWDKLSHILNTNPQN
jgi:hypothetical protein